MSAPALPAVLVEPGERLVGRLSGGRAVRRWAAGLTVLLLSVGLAAVASFPTGHATVEGVVPDGARLAARAQVAGVHVLLTVDGGDLVTRVAYEGEKGWHGIAVDPVPGRTTAAWTATTGNDEVPALSAVYGRALGARITVHWADGVVGSARPARDGAYVVAREGRVEVDAVRVVDESGIVTAEVTDL